MLPAHYAAAEQLERGESVITLMFSHDEKGSHNQRKLDKQGKVEGGRDLSLFSFCPVELSERFLPGW